MDKLFNPSQVSKKMLCSNGHAMLPEFHNCSHLNLLSASSDTLKIPKVISVDLKWVSVLPN